MVAGRAFFVVLLRFQLLCGAAGVPGAACCVRPGCSVCPPSTAHDLPSSVWPLCVPVGGGPPARSPHASLTARSGRSRGPPWPCRHPPAPRPGPDLDPVPHPQPSRPALTPLIPEPTRNFARNSPATASSFEFRSLELQRFQTLLKLLPIELRATFLEGRP